MKKIKSAPAAIRYAVGGRQLADQNFAKWKLHLRQSKSLNQFALIVLCLISLVSFACTNQRLLKSNKNAATTNPAEMKQTSFESDLETMKTANFDYIFVFRRKDGGAFDGEDRKYLRNNSPAQINRFVLTDDGKAFIAGSKYIFPMENLETLRMRFNVEDYSAVKEELQEKTNQETDKENNNATK
ncbi:MAG: hypothetical protein WKF71_02935 [Pyrinomonadaceae bacterium]